MQNPPRKVLLNPGPSTTTNSVKWAQVMPDICPREKEFSVLLCGICSDILRIVHAPERDFACVLFSGSGTLNIDTCLNSLLDTGKKVLILRNGVFSARAQEICSYYGLPHVVVDAPWDAVPDTRCIEQALQADSSIGLVYCTHHETGTGLLNPIRRIGELAHRYSAISVVDTTSSFALLPIDVVADHIDFCMSSSQKGLAGPCGLSFIIGRRSIIEQSAAYPKRSYYCNLFRQYDFFRHSGEMHFTPPVQTVYATAQALAEFFAEGERPKLARIQRIMAALRRGADGLGLRVLVPPEAQAGLVLCVRYPDDPRWDFSQVHDFCYARGYTIYRGVVPGMGTFRLAAMGAIDESDITGFFTILREAMECLGVQIPAHGEH